MAILLRIKEMNLLKETLLAQIRRLTVTKR
jgi:hypothetical protein